MWMRRYFILGFILEVFFPSLLAWVTISRTGGGKRTEKKGD